MNKRTDLGDLATCSAPHCTAEPNALAPFPLCAKHLRETYEFCLSLVDDRWTEVVQQMREAQPEPQPQLLGRDAFTKRPGKVYFIRKDGLIKIGWSQSPRKRFYVLQPDEVLHITEGTMEDEHALHARFAHCLDRGAEWFRPEADLLAYIEGIKANAA